MHWFITNGFTPVHLDQWFTHAWGLLLPMPRINLIDLYQFDDLIHISTRDYGLVPDDTVNLSHISHWGQKWRQRYAAYAPTWRSDTPTSVRNTSNSGRGRLTPGRSRRPPPQMEFWMCLVDIVQHMWRTGGYPTGFGMDCPGPNPRRDH